MSLGFFILHHHPDKNPYPVMAGLGQEIWRAARLIKRLSVGPIPRIGRRFNSTESITVRINRALAETPPCAAFDVLAEYSRSGNNLPTKYMFALQEKLRKSPEPLLVRLFVDLLPLTAVRHRHKFVNGAVDLYISLGDLETALDFIREVQIVNSGAFEFQYEVLERMIIAAKYQNDAEIAWQAMQMIVANSSNMVYARTWGIFLSTILEARHHESLQWFYKTAAIPGFIVLDDSSYLSMASIAAENGDPHMCRWAALRMRRRQRALGVSSPPKDLLKVFVYLVEASAGKGEYKAACRYIVRLRDSTSSLRSSDFHQLLALLRSEDTVFEYYIGIYHEMSTDPLANEAVKTLLFNLLLESRIQATQYQQGLTLYQHARDAAVVFNNTSRLLIVHLGTALWDKSLIESMKCGDPKVDQAVSTALESVDQSV